MVDPGNISRSRQQVLALDYSSIMIYLAQAASAWHVQYSSEHEHGSSLMYLAKVASALHAQYSTVQFTMLAVR